MSNPTKTIFTIALALLAVSLPTCRWGENAVNLEMAKYPADFLAAHKFDWIFFRWTLPGVAMFLLGCVLSVVAIIFSIVDLSTARRKAPTP